MKNVCVVFFTFLVVWQAAGQTPKPTASEAVNIVIILDISDRIDPSNKYTHSDQIQRDIEIVDYIATGFEEKLVRKHLGKPVNDPGRVPHELTVAIPKQPKAPSIPSNIMKNLTIKDSVGGENLPKFEEKRKLMLQSIRELYQWKDNPFTGADIWSWFNNYARYDLKKDGFQNYIICLSDGYLKFDPTIEAHLPKGNFMIIPKWREAWKNNPNWKDEITTLSPTKKDFKSYPIKFMMVEINPRVDEKTGIENPADFDIIEAYWKKWLDSIGITDSEFHRQIPIERLKEVIDSFFVPFMDSK